MAISYLKLPFIDRVKQNREAFGKKVISIANSLFISPNWLMVVMNNETAGTMNSSIKNPTSTATGLIQFMEATARTLGTSTAQLAAMRNVEQLDYVKAYLKPYARKIKSVSDCYLAVFFPQALDMPNEWAFPKWASDANRIFDLNRNGILTKGEFVQYVNDKYGQYLKNEFEAAYQLKKKP